VIETLTAALVSLAIGYGAGSLAQRRNNEHVMQEAMRTLEKYVRPSRNNEGEQRRGPASHARLPTHAQGTDAELSVVTY
jgi:hypothetical protein